MYIFVYCIFHLLEVSCIFAHLYMYYICGIWPLWNTICLFLTWYQSPEFRVLVIVAASSPRHPPVPVLAVALFPRIPISTLSPVPPVASPRPRGSLVFAVRSALSHSAPRLQVPPTGSCPPGSPRLLVGRRRFDRIRPATSCSSFRLATSARIAPCSGPPAWYSIRPASSARIAPRSGQLEAAASAAWTSAVRPGPASIPSDARSIPSDACSSCSLP
jgi:hypothetical protein